MKRVSGFATEEELESWEEASRNCFPIRVIEGELI